MNLPSKLNAMWWLPVIFLGLVPTESCAQGLSKCCEAIDKSGRLEVRKLENSNFNCACGCADFQFLDFKKSSTVSFPSCVNLKAVKGISFKKTAIRRIPEEVFSCLNLESLDLSHCEFYVLPDEVADLSSLKSLDLRGTHITLLPSGLDHLERIDMRMIEMNREEQMAIRNQYPNLKIFFSSPCHCS